MLTLAGPTDGLNAITSEKGKSLVLKPYLSFLLTINHQKTHITKLTKGFNFIAFNFVKRRSPTSGRNSIYVFPSKRSQQSIRNRLKYLTCRRSPIKPQAFIEQIKPVALGWVTILNTWSLPVKLLSDCRVLLITDFADTWPIEEKAEVLGRRTIPIANSRQCACFTLVVEWSSILRALRKVYEEDCRATVFGKTECIQSVRRILSQRSGPPQVCNRQNSRIGYRIGYGGMRRQWVNNEE